MDLISSELSINLSFDILGDSFSIIGFYFILNHKAMDIVFVKYLLHFPLFFTLISAKVLWLSAFRNTSPNAFASGLSRNNLENTSMITRI